MDPGCQPDWGIHILALLFTGLIFLSQSFKFSELQVTLLSHGEDIFGPIRIADFKFHV